jgi:hypothetical protein
VWLCGEGINCPLNCVVCNGNFKDPTHVLFLCPFTANIWHDSGVRNYVRLAVNSRNNVAETIFLLLQNLEEQKFALLAVIMRSIWKHCNIKLWNNVTETKEQLLNRDDHLLQDWRIAKNITLQQRPKPLLSCQNHRCRHIGKSRLGCIGRNLKRVGTSVILMLHFRLIGTELILVCVSVTMKAVSCLPKQCGVHLCAGVDIGETLGSRVTITIYNEWILCLNP